MTRIFRWATLVSGIALMSTYALWVSSHFKYSGATIPLTFSIKITAGSGKGVIRGTILLYLRGTNEGFLWWSIDPQRMPPHITMFKKSFSFNRGRVSARDGSPISMTIVCFPHWLLVILFAVLPVRWVFVGLLRPRRRKQLGLCVQCGYDLTGNTSGACSECGKSFGEAHGKSSAALYNRMR